MRKALIIASVLAAPTGLLSLFCAFTAITLPSTYGGSVGVTFYAALGFVTFLATAAIFALAFFITRAISER